MKVIFISTDGESLEARIKIDEQNICVMDEFGGDDLASGEEVDIEITVGLYSDAETWESIFKGNPNKEKNLDSLGGWRYRAYGMVTSVNPVLVDIGLMRLEDPITTHDERVIGEFVAFRVERLDARSKPVGVRATPQPTN